jgi:hypothetical protein
LLGTRLLAVPSTYRYKSPSTSHSYVLNTTAATFSQAERACARLGGAPVSYHRDFEQAEVEGYFIEAGVLLPGFHKRYWLGLTIPYKDPRLWPQFQWSE